MRPEAFRDFDLNLLRVLDALLTEGSVTRAAAQLGLTQSAVSHALGRLRRQLDDPLFVRTAGRMAPTARAARMAAPLRQALEGARKVLDDVGSFDPAHAHRTFRLHATDALQGMLIPALATRISRDAPGVGLSVTAGPGPLTALDKGEIDIALGHFDDAPTGARREMLFSDRLVLIARAGHPEITAPPTLERFIDAGHVRVEALGKSARAVDAALARRGMARNIAVSVPSALAAARVVAASDLVATVPTTLARQAEVTLDVQAWPLPVDVPPFVISQVWHERQHHEADHAWLRETIGRAVSRAFGSAEPAMALVSVPR